MKIVVLDDRTVNPGLHDWEPLRALGECTVHEHTPPEGTVERALGAPVVLTDRTVMDGPVLEQLDGLRYVGILATGCNTVDLATARRRGVTVTNIPGYATLSVAQHAFALLLELTSRVSHYDGHVRAGRWVESRMTCVREEPQVELAGLTMGIIGLGRSGTRVAELARAFGMTVIACTRTPKNLPDIEEMDLDSLLTRSDVVSIHVPLTDQTEGMISAERIAKMKRTAFLINTARGAVVDGAALAEALNAARIAGAAVDVLATEPPGADDPLVAARNCYITPHLAWSTVAARRRLLETAVGNLRAFLAGRPVNVVTT